MLGLVQYLHILKALQLLAVDRQNTKLIRQETKIKSAAYKPLMHQRGISKITDTPIKSNWRNFQPSI